MDYKTQNEEFNKAIYALFNGKTTMERAKAANHLGYLKDGRAINSLAKAMNTEKDQVVINRIIEETEEIALGVLFENYKKVFPDKKRKEFQVIVRELLENNMIRESYAAAGDFFFTVTNEGLVYIRKRM